MSNNERESEKSLRKPPENEKVRHHLISALTAKINLINNEVKGHEENIKMHKDQIEILEKLADSRKTNLTQYYERKQYLLDYKFPEEQPEEIVIVESVEPPKKEDKKDDKTAKLLSLLKNKGIDLDTVITNLEE